MKVTGIIVNGKEYPIEAVIPYMSDSETYQIKRIERLSNKFFTNPTLTKEDHERLLYQISTSQSK